MDKKKIDWWAVLKKGTVVCTVFNVIGTVIDMLTKNRREQEEIDKSVKKYLDSKDKSS